MESKITKLCRVCRDRKPIAEFHKRKTYKDGYDSRCKLCELKYDRKRVERNKAKASGLKKCSNCYENKSIGDFYKRGRAKDGLRSACKQCESKNNKKYRDNNPTKQRLSKIRYEYGLNADDYQSLLEQQEYKCAICNESKELCVDHCHTTSNVRGLLCHDCNRGLGSFKDDIHHLESAIKYLENAYVG